MTINNVKKIFGILALIAGTLSAGDDTGAVVANVEHRAMRSSGSRPPNNPGCDPESVYDQYLEECRTFCSDYFRLCVNPGFFPPGGDGWDDCMHNCVRYPRPDHTIRMTQIALGSDSFYCREQHLSFGEFSPADAAFHCYHAAPDGGGICTDATLGGRTPFEHMRDGKCTHHRFGYCDLSADDTVADCTNAGITDETLPAALSLLPRSVRVVFMIHNQGITSLPSGIFENLQRPRRLRAIYFDDCNITSIDGDAFNPLRNLEMLSMNLVNVMSLPPTMLHGMPNLRYLSMFGGSPNSQKPGLLTSIPAEFFRMTREIESIIMYGHQGLTSLPAGIFDGLTHCTIISFVSCGLTNDGIPSGLFDDLESLLFFDFFGNQLTFIDPSWFGRWSRNINRVVMWGNNIEEVEANTFQHLRNLEHVYLHSNPIVNVPRNLFSNNPRLNTFTM